MDEKKNLVSGLKRWKRTFRVLELNPTGKKFANMSRILAVDTQEPTLYLLMDINTDVCTMANQKLLVLDLQSGAPQDLKQISLHPPPQDAYQVGGKVMSSKILPETSELSISCGGLILALRGPSTLCPQVNAGESWFAVLYPHVPYSDSPASTKK